MADAVRKIFIYASFFRNLFSKPGHPLNLAIVPFCKNLIFYSLEFVCIYLGFHGINIFNFFVYWPLKLVN